MQIQPIKSTGQQALNVVGPPETRMSILEDRALKHWGTKYFITSYTSYNRVGITMPQEFK